MPVILEAIAPHFSLRLALGVLLFTALVTVVRCRFLALLRTGAVEPAEVAVYQSCGRRLASLTGFTAIFLPGLLLAVGIPSVLLVMGLTISAPRLLARRRPA